MNTRTIIAVVKIVPSRMVVTSQSLTISAMTILRSERQDVRLADLKYGVFGLWLQTVYEIRNPDLIEKRTLQLKRRPGIDYAETAKALM
jgi:hypothetical protein